MFKKRNLLTTLGVLAFLSWAMIIFAYSTGKTGHTSLGAAPGCTCHGAQASAVDVQISGPDTLQVNDSATYQVTITGGPLNGGGVNIAANGGDLATLNNALKKSGAELTHTSPASAVEGKVTFEFEFTAPAGEGSVTLAAVGNSVNLNGGSSGDAWNFAPDKSINVVAATTIAGELGSIPSNFLLGQNYPNPFNPLTTIPYQLDVPGSVDLSVYNLLGQKIMTLVNDFQNRGNYNVTLDASSLESGTYIYRLTLNGQSQTKRFLVIK